MIRRLALLIATAAITILATAGIALAAPAPAPAPAPPASTALTQCTQLQFLGPDAVAACNLGPPGPGVISQILHSLNPGNWLNGVNNTCQPGLPMPESESGSGLLSPSPVPAAQRTLYSSYGTSGLFWAPFNLQCAQWEDLLGNSWANGIFTMAKGITSVTLAVVHAATTPGLLNSIQATIDKAIIAVGSTAKQWMTLIIMLGGAYMGWALIRHRSREVLTSVLHMIVFAIPLLLLVAMPQLWTGVPAWVVNSATQVSSDIFTSIPATGTTSTCLAASPGDPGSGGEKLSAADHGTSALWGFMACRPWLAGEFADPAMQAKYGRALLFSQSFMAGEPQNADTTALKTKLYGGVDNEINQHTPGAVDLFEGNLWQQRTTIAIVAVLMDLVLAAVFIGLACTLLFAQVWFYLLMVAAPVILLIGMYPGAAARAFCLRWYERMLGLLARMAIATVLLTGMLWVFGLLSGLSGSWLIQGLLIIGAGTALLVKRKQIIAGAVTARGSMAARITGTPNAQPAGAETGGHHRAAPRRAAAAIAGAAAGYEVAHDRTSRSTEDGTIRRTARAGQKLAAAYSTGGLATAGTAVAGMTHGRVQRRRDERAGQAAKAEAEAAEKEQQWRAELPGKVHQKMAMEQLNGVFPEGKAATEPAPEPEPFKGDLLPGTSRPRAGTWDEARTASDSAAKRRTGTWDEAKPEPAPEPASEPEPFKGELLPETPRPRASTWEKTRPSGDPADSRRKGTWEEEKDGESRDSKKSA